ncbi:MAG: carbohydrate binding family 9 domain-containing protein [Gemmatimonadetes bacterium]|nr:carbohydrate binding family 9 domain-containing protein [Gemmatimonadota bacterium]
MPSIMPFLLVAIGALAPMAQETPSAGRPAGGPEPQSVHSAPGVAEATRATEVLRIDGRDDEAVWRTAPRSRGFRMFVPRVDVDPTFETEFQVAYDERNLYVFVRMFDPHPDSIMRALSRRDVRGPSDQIKLLIDSYDDHRTGYELAVNPDGVKRDYAMANDSDEDDSWDGIWDVGTAIDSLGWTAEFRVPLSQLRYADSPEHTFGFGIWRDIERLNERSSWPLFSQTRQGIVSQLGRLTGLRGLSGARRVALTPYVVAKNLKQAGPGFAREQEFTVGGDLKVGLTPNLTLDATVNPDFGQVEADPAVVNLTAFEVFFSERRPFFVEGNGFYQFALNCYIVVDCQTNEGLFYSRRIGRSPSLRGRYGDASTPSATPIAAATKLTGRTRSGLSFGLLDALTQRVDGVGGQVVEPQTNYAVFRANQDLRGGKAGVSFIGTAVNRTLDALSDPFLHRSAYSAGATVRNRFLDDNFEVIGQLSVSRVDGTAAAITRTQQSPVHFYQQPGDRHDVDTTLRSLGGTAAQIKVGKYGGGITRFESSLVRQSAGFDVNDLGFLRRADVVNWSTWGALTWREAKWIYRWAQLNGNHWISTNTSGDRTDHSVNANGHIGLRNNWDLHLGGTLVNISNTQCDRCTRGGPLLRNARGFFPWGGVNTDSRKAVSGGIFVNLGRTDEGRTHRSSLSPYVNFRFSTRATVGLGLGYSEGSDETQWYGNFTDGAGTTHYAFAHLDQTTVSTNIRMNYTATPRLTFEFYGEPFVSRGRYSDVRQISGTPEAERYADRFVPYVPPAGSPEAFKFEQLRANAVVRWEFQPGSTLFVVWQHGKESFSDDPRTQPWTKDYRELFDRQPDNTFLIKMAYWLSR